MHALRGKHLQAKLPTNESYWIFRGPDPGNTQSLKWYCRKKYVSLSDPPEHGLKRSN